MKTIICLFVLLALTTGVHGDDKKKKPAANKAPARAPGGGGGGGGGAMHMPSTSHSNPARGLGQAPRSSSAPRVNSHTAPSATNRLTTHSTTGGPASGKAGQGVAGGQSSNPLLKKGGQAGSNGQGSNPLTRGNNRQAGAAVSNPGARNGNPLAKKSAGQSGLNGRNASSLTGRNNANLNGRRALGAQNARGFNNRAGYGQRAAHANYRVRPYRDVFHNYRAVRHDRGWYASRYDRVVVMGGGYYYWDAGYWYPAWGYDPAISFYVYDGPIYSYDNLPPDQVTMNVQAELQDEGYYTGEVDGQVGPKTRDALGAYQTDHNLEVTSAIDEPTVEALGLTGST